MTAVTLSPRSVCSATVPPQPRISSSGWAAMTSTESVIDRLPAFSLPVGCRQLTAFQHPAVLGFHFQQRNRTLPARDELAAGVVDRADDRSQTGARLSKRERPERRECGLPHDPALAL